MILSWGAFAQAAPIFQLGNNPEPDEQNVLFGTAQTGTTIAGTTNQSGTPVTITSTQTLTTAGVGQGFIRPVSGVFTDFVVTLPGSTFTDIIFNPQIGGQPRAEGGTASLTVTTSEGVFDFSYALARGENFLTIVAGAGETISSVAFTATEGFNTLRQVRVSGVSGGGGPTPVPEPLSMTIFGLGLAGLGLVRRATRPDAAGPA